MTADQPVTPEPRTPDPSDDPDAARRQRRALLLRWTLIPVALVVGGLLSGYLSASGARAGWSFVLGLAITVAAFEFGSYNVRFTARWFPGLTLAAAIGSYALTVIAIGLVYALSSPSVIDGMTVGIGIFCAVGLWIGTEIERARVRSVGPSGPVRVLRR